ncbi:hypothetical protein TNCV_2537581 [Trichonephila clavipes]|nr:hypothetical protein TNCV_2537581 [Trichonephila clavipes]
MSCLASAFSAPDVYTRQSLDDFLHHAAQFETSRMALEYNKIALPVLPENLLISEKGTATDGSNVVQSGRPIFDDFFQHLWPYIGNNTANVVFQMVKRLWFIRIDQ